MPIHLGKTFFMVIFVGGYGGFKPSMDNETVSDLQVTTATLTWLYSLEMPKVCFMWDSLYWESINGMELFIT